MYLDSISTLFRTWLYNWSNGPIVFFSEVTECTLIVRPKFVFYFCLALGPVRGWQALGEEHMCRTLCSCRKMGILELKSFTFSSKNRNRSYNTEF